MGFAIGFVVLDFNFTVHSENYPAAYFQLKWIYTADASETYQ